MREMNYADCVEVADQICRYNLSDVNVCIREVERLPYPEGVDSRRPIYDSIGLVDWAYGSIGLVDWAYGVGVWNRLLQDEFTPWMFIYKLLVKVHERLIRTKRMERLEDKTLVEVTML